MNPIPSWFDTFTRLPVRTVTVDSHRIAYLDSGSGPPVLLIHGLGGSMWQWEYQQRSLADGYRVVTLDMLGSGLSDKPDVSYTPERLIHFFSGFMDALKIQRGTLIGNSMGAGVAIGMALTRPDRVNRLVLIGGLPARIAENVGGVRFKRILRTPTPAWLLQLTNFLVGRKLTRRVLKDVVHNDQLLTPLVLERSFQNRRRPGFIPPIMSHIKNIPLWEAGFASRLHNIAVPTLILWGAEDRFFPLPVAHDLHRMIPHSVLEVIPEAGHLPQWEQPDLVNRILLEFLSA